MRVSSNKFPKGVKKCLYLYNNPACRFPSTYTPELIPKRTVYDLCGKHKLYLLGETYEGKSIWITELEYNNFDYRWRYERLYTVNNKETVKQGKFIDGVPLNAYVEDEIVWQFFIDDKAPGASFAEKFAKITLTHCETCQLIELFRTFHALRDSAILLFGRDVDLVSKDDIDVVSNIEEVDRINKVAIPKILDSIYGLLTPERERMAVLHERKVGAPWINKKQ